MHSQFLLLILASSCYSYKLNVPKALLPFRKSAPVNFTLEVTDPGGGCFTWSSSRPDVAAVFIPNEHSTKSCSDRAIVSAVSKQPHRATAVISARDSASGLVLRCDIIVDTIHSIEIMTTTRELYLDDSPEVFEVLAKNDQGDTFSELAGVAFKWSLEMDFEETDKVLRMLRFDESKYEVEPAVQHLQQMGLQGHAILVEGAQTGAAYATVSVDEEPYMAVTPSKISLIVVAHLTINPSWVIFIPRYATVHYDVEVIRFGRAEPILMPSDQYYLELSDTSVGLLDVDSSNVTGMQIGQTEVILQDKNMKFQQGTIREPRAVINVVVPSYLGFGLQPGKEWVLETGRIYEIFVEIYEKNGNKLYLTDNIYAEAIFPAEFMEVLAHTSNGTWFLVKTLKNGFTTISASFEKVHTRHGTFAVKPPVSGSVSVDIYDPIQLKPEVVAFAWDPRMKVPYHIQMEASGGSGSYQWYVDNTNVVKILEQSGLVSTLSAGVATVFAADVRNKINKASSNFYVVSPTRIEIAPCKLEVRVGEVLSLPLRMFGNISVLNPGFKEIELFDCSLVSISTTFDKDDVVDVLEGLETPNSSEGPHCAFVKFLGKSADHVKISVKYSSASGNIIVAEAHISVYNSPLIIDPSHSPVLAIGSSWNITVKGGPKPWILDRSKFFRKVMVNATDQTSVSALKDLSPDTFQINVRCKSVGTMELRVAIGNLVNHAAIEHVSLKVLCDVPIRLQVSTQLITSNSGRPCPIAPDTDDLIPVYYKEPVELIAAAFDGLGRRFDSIESLLVQWEVSDMQLLSIPSTSTPFDVEFLYNYRFFDTSRETLARFYKVLETKGNEGSVIVSATVESYRHVWCTGTNCQKFTMSAPVRDDVKLLLTDKAAFSSKEICLFNNPLAKKTVHILKGSGHYEAISNEQAQRLAKVTVIDRAVEIEPTDNGKFDLELRDLCICPHEIITASVQISDIAQIEILGPRFVQTGGRVAMQVKVRNEAGLVLNDVLSLLQLKLIVDEPLTISTKLASLESDESFHFTVEGRQIGTTSIRVTAVRADGGLLTSASQTVQVYGPLKLLPKNITLVIGAKHKISVSGGPQPIPEIAYSMNSSDVVSIDSDGLLTARSIGVVALKAQVNVKHFESMEDIVLSQATALVWVVELSGIRIHAPVTTVQIDTELPLYAHGTADGVDPFSFASFDLAPFEFVWKVMGESSEQPGILQSVYHQNRISENASGKFSRRFVATKPGRATVRLTVRHFLESSGKSNELISTITIEVLDPFQGRDMCSRSILMAPKSSIQLVANKQHPSQLVQWSLHSMSTTAATGHGVSIDSNGQLTAGPGATFGDYIVTAKTTSFSGLNSTVISLVEVKSISYLMINALADLLLSKPSSHIPLGCVLDYTVTFHDVLGRRFDAASASLDFGTQRSDIAEIVRSSTDNQHSFSVRMRRVGNTALKVWSPASLSLIDYVPVNIDVDIEPNVGDDGFTLGDVICFSSSLASNDTTRRSAWHSDGVVVIDDVTGVAVAGAVGSSMITLKSLYSTHARVAVRPAVEIQFNFVQTKQKFVSTFNCPYVFPVLLKSESIAIAPVGSNVVGQDGCREQIRLLKNSKLADRIYPVPFRCDLKWASSPAPSSPVSPLAVFSVTAAFDFEIGSYACVVKLLPSENLVDQVDHLDSNVSLVVYIAGSDGQGYSPISMPLPFYPAFTASSKEIKLNNLNQAEVTLTVQSSATVLKSLKIHTNRAAEDYITITAAETHAVAHQQYQIKLRPESPNLWISELTKVELEIFSDLTQQRITLPVIIKLYGDPPRGVLAKACPIKRSGFWVTAEFLWDTYYSIIVYVVALSSSLIAAFIVHRFLAQYRSFPTTTTQPVFASSGGLSPQGQQMSPSANVWQSHRHRGESTYLWSNNSFQNGSPPPYSYKNGSPNLSRS